MGCAPMTAVGWCFSTQKSTSRYAAYFLEVEHFDPETLSLLIELSVAACWSVSRISIAVPIVSTIIRNPKPFAV